MAGAKRAVEPLPESGRQAPKISVAASPGRWSSTFMTLAYLLGAVTAIGLVLLVALRFSPLSHDVPAAPVTPCMFCVSSVLCQHDLKVFFDIILEMGDE